MKNLSAISISHKTASLGVVGHFHIDEKEQQQRLTALRDNLGMEEVMYLTTCNRVEFLFYGAVIVDEVFLRKLHEQLFPENAAVSYTEFHAVAETYEGLNAIEHLFRVAASLDSMVVGEREIITQVRQAFDNSRAMKLSGDTIRLVMRKTIETAKQVYTETDIARKPVSVVSLAYKALRDFSVDLSARVVIVGAGKTNRTMSKFLLKHGFSNFTVYNRTLTNAQELASELKGTAKSLDQLPEHTGGFDVLITCTGSAEHVITPEIYQQLLANESHQKVVIDLAVPNDVAPEVMEERKVRYLNVETLQEVARENLKSRKQEVACCEEIIAKCVTEFELMFRERQVERALGAIPVKIKEIRETAMSKIFHREMESLDDQSKEVIEKMMDYFEKKYIGIPMKMAKDILIQNRQ